MPDAGGAGEVRGLGAGHHVFVGGCLGFQRMFADGDSRDLGAV